MRAAVALVALAAAGGAGCGGDGESAPDAVAREFVSTNDPAKCDLLTPELLETQTGRRGADARSFCAMNVVREPRPAAVKVIEAEVTGGKAVVELLVDNREDRLELVRRDGRWLIFATGR